MSYEISKELWHICKITGAKIKDLAKKYGGNGKYYTDVFIKYLEEEHSISVKEYLVKYCGIICPKCSCGICDKESKVIRKEKTRSNFSWEEYVCGRFPETLEWSKKAKEERKGAGNPMYGKSPWNDGLTKETNKILLEKAERRKGSKLSPEHIAKLCVIAQNRTVHGHTGCRHTEESKDKMRQSTLKMIKEGRFKQTKTKPHIEFARILDSLSIKYEEECIVGHWSVDFYLPEFGVYCEVDGDYFHSNPKIYPDGPKTKTQKINQSRDYAKNKYFQSNCLILLRFWECDILNDEEKIKCKLNQLIQLDILVSSPRLI